MRALTSQHIAAWRCHGERHPLTSECRTTSSDFRVSDVAFWSRAQCQHGREGRENYTLHRNSCLLRRGCAKFVRVRFLCQIGNALITMNVIQLAMKCLLKRKVRMRGGISSEALMKPEWPGKMNASGLRQCGMQGNPPV